MNRQAEEIFQRFRSLPGAQFIASPCAIEGLLDTVERYRPRRILEVGAGIGTLTAAILATAPADAAITTVEDNTDCLEYLDVNLGSALERVQLLASTGDVSGEYDLVVVDGHQIIDVIGYVARDGLVLVEGDRAPQRDALYSSGRRFCAKHVRTTRPMAHDDPWSHAARERYQGGYYLFRLEPSTIDRARFAVSDWWNNRMIGSRRRARRVLGLERA